MTWEEAASQCPPGVTPACHNSQTTVTVSGDKEAVLRFVKDVSDKGMFCRTVNSVGVAFHSRHMEQVAPLFRTALADVSYIELFYQSNITQPIVRLVSICFREIECMNDKDMKLLYAEF